MASRSPVTPVAMTGATQAIRANAATYYGATIRETAAAVAVVRIWDNPSAASGTLLDTISLPASGSVNLFYPDGIRAASGVYLEKVSGTIEGSVRVG